MKGANVTRRFFLLMALSLLTRAPLVRAPPLGDEPVHLLGSWTLLDGHRLYQDFADNKPPLLYASYALAQVLFGRGLDAVRCLTLIAIVPLTALACSAFFRHDRRGLCAAVLYLVISVCCPAEDGLAVNSELLMLLPAAWAFVAMARLPAGHAFAWGLVAGGLLGLATLFKVTAVLWLPAAPIALLLVGHGRWTRAVVRSALGIGLGFAFPLAATGIVFAAQGGVHDLWYWTLGHNFGYIGQPIPAGEAAVRAARGVLPWLLVCLPLTGAWAAVFRRVKKRYRHALSFALLVLAAPAIVLGLRFYAHYFIQLLVPVALGAAPVVAHLTRRRLSTAALVGAAGLATAFIGFSAANVYLIHGPLDILESRRPFFRDIARWLRRDPCFAGSTLFVWGLAPQLYLESGRPPASRFVLPQETISGHVPGRLESRLGPPDSDRARQHWDLLMADLERNAATYLIDTAPSGFHHFSDHPLADYPRLREYVQGRFELTAVVDGVAIYRRLGCGDRSEGRPTSSR